MRLKFVKIFFHSDGYLVSMNGIKLYSKTGFFCKDDLICKKRRKQRGLPDILLFFIKYSS